jgi:adiponectin receptor
MKLLEDHLIDLETYAYDRIRDIHPIDYVDSSLHAGADIAKQHLDQLTQAIKNGALRLLTIDEIPSDWHNNPHILRGYRFYENKMQCVYSIVKIHNETGNIWTHIVGFFFVLAMGVYWYPRSASYEISTTADKFVCAVFFFAALECLACSTIWHTFSNFANLAAVKKIACIGMMSLGTEVDDRLCWDFSIDCGDNHYCRVSWILLSACCSVLVYHGHYRSRYHRDVDTLARVVRSTVNTLL